MARSRTTHTTRQRSQAVAACDLCGALQALAAAGIQELVVVAEDSTAYGLDTTRKRQIHVLLEKLGEVEGIRWIRLMYAYPHTVLPELTAFLREHPYLVADAIGLLTVALAWALAGEQRRMLLVSGASLVPFFPTAGWFSDGSYWSPGHVAIGSLTPTRAA